MRRVISAKHISIGVLGEVSAIYRTFHYPISFKGNYPWPNPHNRNRGKTSLPLDASTYPRGASEVKRNIDAEVELRRAEEVENLRLKVTETAQSLGVSIEELFGIASASRQRGTRETLHAKAKQPAKYRGPSGEEWSGRGPAPRWMKPLLAKGKTKADFLIK